MIYAQHFTQHFTRQNFNMRPPLDEEVCVVFETDIPYDNDHIEEFDRLVWNELFRQYPIWRCPYHSQNPPPNDLEKWRHGFCSPGTSGPVIVLGQANPHYENFRRNQS